MDLKNRIEDFFNGTLTFDEEQELYLYLCSNEVPPQLQHDKEVIIAICSDCNDYTLPAGANERLVAMLDTLAHSNTEASPVIARKPLQMSLKRVPIYVWSSVAAVLLTILIMLPPMIGEKTADAEIYEQDTFATPEEAMDCAKSVLGDLILAMNNTRRNAMEIGVVLEETAQKCNYKTRNKTQ